MIKQTLFFLCFAMLLCTFSCQKDLYNFKEKFSIPTKSTEAVLVEYIVTGDENSIVEGKNIEKIADYTKIPFKKITVKSLNQGEKIAPTTRVICISNTLDLEDQVIADIFNFVSNGGSLFFTKPQTDERVFFLMGLKPSANLERDSTAFGYHFIKPVLSGRKGFKYNNAKNVHGGYKAENFREELEIQVVGFNKTKYPVLLDYKLGKGMVSVLNSSQVLAKAERGLFFSQVLKGLEGIPYPIANVATIFLDDFPSPTYAIYKEPIKTELGLTVSDYVSKVWWPDMKKFAKENNITYTAYAIFDYNTHVLPPFTFKEWDLNNINRNGVNQNRSAWIGKEVINSGHEMALHGYNHVSLLKEDWKQSEYMATALESASKKWKLSSFGKLPVSYVPPSNYIDSIGLANLQKGMPSLRYVQSTYFGALEDGGNREFDPDPYNDWFFSYPRISSGYYLEPENWYLIESLYLFTGIWTHFVHPDDVYQLPNPNDKTSGHFTSRNKHKLNWYSKNGKQGMFDRFKKEVNTFNEIHPMTRYLGATESSEIVRDWRYSYFSHLQLNGEYLVENDDNKLKGKNSFWFLYVTDKNVKLIEKDLKDKVLEFKKRPMLEGFLYTIETKEAALLVPDMHFLEVNNGSEELLLKAAEELNSFNDNRFLLKPFHTKISDLIEKGDVLGATNLIEAYLDQGNNLDIQEWRTYLEYLGWQDRTNRFWYTLNKAYNQNASEKMASYAKIFSKEIGYPTVEKSELWLLRQIEWGTTDLEVLKEYVSNFNNEKNKIKIHNILERIYSLEPNIENKKQLIIHTIDYKMSGLEGHLKGLDPCDPRYEDISETITWSLADNHKLKEAIKWSKCAPNITEENVNNWKLLSGNYQDLEKTNFPVYLEYLIADNPAKAIAKLLELEPCQSDSLTKLAANIAYVCGDFKLYKEALAWAECAEDLPVNAKLSWLYELKKYSEMKRMYSTYTNSFPEDYNTKVHMGVLLYYMGDIEAVAQIATNLPLDVDKGTLRKNINKEVSNMDISNQRKFLKRYPELLYPKVIKEIRKKIRLQEGNDISALHTSFYDKLERTLAENSLGYSFYDAKENVHSVSAIQANVFPIQGIPKNKSNQERDLWGIEYGFKTESKKKQTYRFRARLERDNTESLYYQVGLETQITKNKYYGSILADYAPVKTGPGYILEIYQARLSNYNEFQLSKKISQIVSLEGNYYSDNEYDAILLTRTSYDVFKKPNYTVSPLIEGSYGIGSVNRKSGFPYWVAKKRIYGGAGLNVKLGTETSLFNLEANASQFFEVDETNFQRYTASLSYRIFTYAQFKAEAEIFTIKSFNSNMFSFGLVYHLK